MGENGFPRCDLSDAPSPCYLVDLERLESNLQLLGEVQKEARCRILLALKGFAMFSVFPQARRHLGGASASSLNEARLAREEFGGEIHVYAPAFKDDEFDEIVEYSDAITFNSWSQWQRFHERTSLRGKQVELGLRINPEYSEVETELYNPCAGHSRLGLTLDEFRKGPIEELSGVLFHSLCGQNSDTLERTLRVVEERFGPYLRGLDWVNFGGGHHITRSDYDAERLIRLVRRFSQEYGVRVYLEPGEAIALNTGVLITTVLDIVHNDGVNIAMLDTSATAHMPDVLEMPYRPEIVGAKEPGALPYTYRLGGMTCLAGDVVGDYSFEEPLRPGSRLVFLDMAHYTMVKNTTFNGVGLPAIATYDRNENRVNVVRRFGYEDYRNRLS